MCFLYLCVPQQVGMQGKGFEPTVEALFGKNGFFPDTLSKTLYWTIDKLPRQDMWYNMAEGVEVFSFSNKEKNNLALSAFFLLTAVLITQLYSLRCPKI